MKKGEGFVKSVVPITARGRVKFLSYDKLPPGVDCPHPKFILEHPEAETLYIGKTFKLGGWVAYFEAYIAIQRYDGEIVLVNSMAAVAPGVVELPE